MGHDPNFNRVNFSWTTVSSDDEMQALTPESPSTCILVGWPAFSDFKVQLLYIGASFSHISSPKEH